MLLLQPGGGVVLIPCVYSFCQLVKVSVGGCILVQCSSNLFFLPLECGIHLSVEPLCAFMNERNIFI